jgi:thiol:disulfide interchange protein
MVLIASVGCGSPAATATPAPAATPPASAGLSQTEAAYAVQTKQAAPQTGTEQVILDKPYDESADPKADISAALALAKTDSKYVLLDFGANWCVDCLVLSKLFEDPTVKPFLDANYHVVRIDVGYWDKNTDVSDQYGNPIEAGIPAVVVLKPDGETVATTKAGELANAETATAQDILTYLQQWAPKK